MDGALGQGGQESAFCARSGRAYPSFPVSADDGPLDRIEWAYDAPLRSPAQKAVLVLLARHADGRDGRAWPSLSSMARRTSLSRRSVIRAVQELERLGWLVCERRDRKVTRYRPKAPDDCKGCFWPLPVGIQFCPVCGAEPSDTVTLGGDRLSLGGVTVSP